MGSCNDGVAAVEYSTESDDLKLDIHYHEMRACSQVTTVYVDQFSELELISLW